MILQIHLTLSTHENIHHQKVNFQKMQMEKRKRVFLGKITVSNFKVLANRIKANQTSFIFPAGKYIYVLHLG